MKVKSIGSNMTLITTPQYEILFSYETPAVAAKEIATGKLLKTDKKWSATTSRQISKWLGGADAETRPQEFFDGLNEAAKQVKMEESLINSITESINWIANRQMTVSEDEEVEGATEDDENNKDRFWYSGEKIELSLSRDEVESIAQQGDNENAVREAIENDPILQKQLASFSDEDIAADLKGYGAWDDEELQDRDMNEVRMVWNAAWQIADNGELDGDEELQEDTQNYNDKFYVFDNGGEDSESGSTDRYTIILADDYDKAYDMDEQTPIPCLISGNDPRGTSGHDSIILKDLIEVLNAPEMEYKKDTYLGDRIEFSQLPEAVQKFAISAIMKFDVDGDDSADLFDNQDLQESNLNESTSDWDSKNVIDSRDIIERIQELEGNWLLDEDEQEELTMLQAVAEDGSNYSSEFEHGETLIRESYWIDYVQELLDDTGDIPKDLPHYIVIDWEATARNIAYDYTTIDINGTDYYMRQS